ncbi:MAG: M56 family metallopeptidase [Lachnospiraceae bacterium]|nr:M56 family metallopeptidase [Lachnospiraceae bacterium]
MENIFQHVIQMSIYGSIAIIAVFILRMCFSSLPKRITCLFWIIPGLRLLCPLNFKTTFSIMNFARLKDNADGTVNEVENAVPNAVTGKPVNLQLMMKEGINKAPVLAHRSIDPKTIVAIIWLLGIMVILTYLTIKTVNMFKVLKRADMDPYGDYYVSDAVDTSFVLGIIRPRIYMQAGLSEQEKSYILQHERTHIKNLDHITRIVGMLTVCIHWFNPLVWIAFTKMCADIEMRCDEAVIDCMGDRIKKEYCTSIVRHALERGTANRGLYAAFAGDNHNGREIKMRIKNLVSYKKVSKIVAAAVVVFALGMTVALSTKAQSKSEDVSSKEQIKVTNEAVTGNREINIKVNEKENDEEKVGAPVSVPGNILLDMTEEENLENYGKEELKLPDDVEYSDEGRPYSKTYDFRETPVLNRLASILEKEGFEILDPDMEYLDKEGNVRTGRELYCFNAYKEDTKQNMLVNIYMVSEEYAEDSYDKKEVRDNLWIGESIDYEEETWYNYRIYDTKTGVMMDAAGNYDWDWESLGLFK